MNDVLRSIVREPGYRRPKVAVADGSFVERHAIALILIAFVLVAFVHFFVEPKVPVEGMPAAHAAEKPVIHQNDWYCAHLSDYVNGSDHALVDFCSQYK